MSIPKCEACGTLISTENELKEGFCADCLWAFSEDANWDSYYEKKVETDDHDQFVSDMQEEPDDRSDEV